MKIPFFKPHIPESLALAGTLAGAFTLNIAWMANLIAWRVPSVHSWLIFTPSVGVLSGLLFVSLVFYLVAFLIILLWYRGRDCSHQREPAYWFLLISILLYLIMTIPGVFEFHLM